LQTYIIQRILKSLPGYFYRIIHYKAADLFFFIHQSEPPSDFFFPEIPAAAVAIVPVADKAFSKARRVTLAESTMPAAAMLIYLSVLMSYPVPGSSSRSFSVMKAPSNPALSRIWRAGAFRAWYTAKKPKRS